MKGCLRAGLLVTLALGLHGPVYHILVKAWLSLVTEQDLTFYILFTKSCINVLWFRQCCYITSSLVDNFSFLDRLGLFPITTISGNIFCFHAVVETGDLYSP